MNTTDDYVSIAEDLNSMEDNIEKIKTLTNNRYEDANSFAAYSVYIYSLNNKYNLSTLNGGGEGQAECFNSYNKFKEDATDFSKYLSQVDNGSVAVYTSALNALSFIFDDAQDTKKAKSILDNINSYIDAHPDIRQEMVDDNVKDILDGFEQGIATGFLGNGEKIPEIVSILTKLTECIDTSNNIKQSSSSNKGLAGDSSYIDTV